MAHDVNGTPLEVGDSVVLEGVITQIQPGEEYCNLTFETDEPMYPGNSKSAVVVNAKQVTLCRRASLLTKA